MKKKFLFILCLLIIPCTVLAYGREGTVSLVESGNGTLMCEYKNLDGEVQNEIFYIFKAIGETQEQSNVKTTWNVFYRNNGTMMHMESHIIFENLTQGSFDWVFRKKKRIHYERFENRMPSSMESTFTCPQYSFNSYDIAIGHDMCFGNQVSCGSKFEKGPFNLSDNANSIYYVMDSYIKEAYSKVTFDEYKNPQTTIEGLLRSKALEATKTRYQFDTKWETPSFVTNYINRNAIRDDDLASLKNRMATETKKAETDGTLTEEEIQEIGKKNKVTAADFTGNNLVPSTGVKPDDDTGCNSILGDDMSKIVNNIFKTIQYAGPILVIVLTALDMLKAVTSGEQDQMKKAGNKFVKRLIAAMLLFFVPILCSIAFDVVGITVPDSCIGQVK